MWTKTKLKLTDHKYDVIRHILISSILPYASIFSTVLFYKGEELVSSHLVVFKVHPQTYREEEEQRTLVNVTEAGSTVTQHLSLACG